MKKYYIETYGCQMNFAQSSQLEKALKEHDIQKTDSCQSADFIIINACCVREHAEIKVFNRIDYFNSIKRKNKYMKLIITGCFAQNHKEKINSDMIIGSSRIKEIPTIIKKDYQNKYINTNTDSYEFLEPVKENKFPFQSMIDITKGCNNYCSYCIVPYVRGNQISRCSSDIISQIKKLADQGIIEIILLGQNVNAYGKDNNDIDFAELLFKINKISGIKRIRFMTSHPKDFSNKIIDSIFQNEKVTPHIHLPLQSGSTKILKLMNRKYNMTKYYNIINKIRSYHMDHSLSTDFLIGFPGETEKDFLKTVRAAEVIRFNEAFLFKFSPRPYIAASKLPGAISEKEKAERLQYLILIQKNIEKEKAIENENKQRTVLVEGKSKRDPKQFIGRDELNYKVIIKEPVSSGELFPVVITHARGITLFGKKINTRSKVQCV